MSLTDGFFILAYTDFKMLLHKIGPQAPASSVGGASLSTIAHDVENLGSLRGIKDIQPVSCAAARMGVAENRYQKLSAGPSTPPAGFEDFAIVVNATGGTGEEASGVVELRAEGGDDGSETVA